MLSVRISSRFKKSLRRISKSGSFDRKKLGKVVDVLSREEKLDRIYKDHSLTGALAEYRECHIEFDMLLIYKKELGNLVLVNIGSHPDLFG